MKRFFAALLCVIMTLSSSICAFAYDNSKSYIKINDKTGMISKLTQQEVATYQKEREDFTLYMVDDNDNPLSTFVGYTIYEPNEYVTKTELIEKLNSVVPRYNSAYSPMKTDSSTDKAVVDLATALTMISEAFGTLPEPEGANLDMAPSDESYEIDDLTYDETIQNLIRARIMPEVNFSERGTDVYYAEIMKAPASEQDIDTLLARVYALYGNNPADDLYSYVNKDYFDDIELDDDQMSVKGPLYELSESNDESVREAVLDIIRGEGYENGSMEQKIKDFYDSKLNMAARNKIGNEPIQYYLDGIDKASTVDELSAFTLRYVHTDGRIFAVG
jgi:putative endopeptidase